MPLPNKQQKDFLSSSKAENYPLIVILIGIPRGRGNKERNRQYEGMGLVLETNF